jgi:hypothetical protein
MEAPGLLSRGRLHQGSGLRAVGDLAYDLQSGGLGKLAWLANRDQERPRAANDAVAKVQVQLRDFPGAGGPLQLVVETFNARGDGQILTTYLPGTRPRRPASSPGQEPVMRLNSWQGAVRFLAGRLDQPI